MKTAIRMSAAGSIILLLFFLTTDPQKLPSVLLIAPFVLLFIIIASSVPLLSGQFRASGQRAGKAGMMVAAVPVLLLILQSLGQLTVRDVLAMVLLFGVAYFYMSRFGLRLTS